MSKVSLDPTPGRDCRMTWGRKDEEYVADFCLVAKRTLDESEHRIFRFHFLLGANWKLCCRRLNMDRGNFFHTVYRIQHKLGKVFRELQPYGLYPIADYFGVDMRAFDPAPQPPSPASPSRRVTPIRPPVAQPRSSDDDLLKAA